MEKTIKKIIAILEKVEGIKGYALIGGLAIGGWVSPRTTRDVDLLMNFPQLEPRLIEDKLLNPLKEAGFVSTLQVGDLEDDIKFCIKSVSPDGIPVDIILVAKKWEEEIIVDSIPIEILEGVAIPVVKPEGLVILKLKAGSFQDIADVVKLLIETDYNHEKIITMAKKARVDRKLKILMEKLGLL
ncbi:nucleotidyl transferase AbiEii/AbiGii toxin family protein [Candidatus Desantisbacteria bacterium]|nr:nucleotidyl transferase AbiEii/AbiGii toxin family protein [Candidatus Desantisbacteria bacterium]